MYLNLLNDRQKEMFLSLAYQLSHKDGTFGAEERDMIHSYCVEMGVDYREEVMLLPYETIVQELNEQNDDRAKRIFLFEVIGLAICDDDYSDREREWLYDFANAISMSRDFCNQCGALICEYISFQNKVNNIIL